MNRSIPAVNTHLSAPIAMMFVVLMAAITPAMGQLTRDAYEQHAYVEASWHCGTTAYNETDESTTGSDPGYPDGRNAFATVTNYHPDHNTGGHAEANFTTSDSNSTLSISHSLDSDSSWSDFPCFSGQAASDGYEYVRSFISFHRTAWFWYNGNNNLDPGFSLDDDESSSVSLSLPGHPGYNSTVTYVGDSWEYEGSICDTGFVTLSSSADLSVLSNEDRDTSDNAWSAADATVTFVECFADWNCDHSVNSADFTAFLNDFIAGNPDADINGDGVVNSQDFMLFNNAFVAGDCVEP